MTKVKLVDRDNPPLTKADFAKLRPAREALPELVGKSAAEAMLKHKPGVRGPQKAPLKVPVTLRLSREVLEAYRATGPGWQTRMGQVLAASAKKGAKR